MDTITGIIAVFCLGVLELWIAIPAGLALKLPPFIIFAASSLGAISAALLVSILGENIRNRFLSWRYKDDNDIKSGSIYNIWYNIWDRYGIIGLGLLSPLLFGAPLGAAVGIALGAQKWRLMLWMTIGILLWSAGLTIAGFFGLMSFESLM
ncbi:MAG: small multi-drug export protein [Euryarchaeota archaeon]|nr:small multi-drug export protein [Euryarchaeota archaeon]